MSIKSEQFHEGVRDGSLRYPVFDKLVNHVGKQPQALLLVGPPFWPLNKSGPALRAAVPLTDVFNQAPFDSCWKEFEVLQEPGDLPRFEHWGFGA